MNIFTDIIYPCISSVFNVLNKPLPLLGGLSIFIVIMAVFVMGIIINIVVAFVNNGFGSSNTSESRATVNEARHQREYDSISRAHSRAQRKSSNAEFKALKNKARSNYRNGRGNDF